MTELKIETIVPITTRGKTVNSEHLRSFKTEANLMKAITKHGFDNLRHMRCRAADGRWIAIFNDPKANAVIFHGFIWC